MPRSGVPSLLLSLHHAVGPCSAPSMSSQDPSDVDDLPDWGAPRLASPAMERVEAAEASPPPPRSPVADDSTDGAQGSSGQLEAIPSDKEPARHARNGSEDEFGEFVYSGKDAAPPNSKLGHDGDDGSAQSADSPEFKASGAHVEAGDDSAEPASTPARAGPDEVSSADDHAPTPSTQHASELGNGRPSPVRPGGPYGRKRQRRITDGCSPARSSRRQDLA